MPGDIGKFFQQDAAGLLLLLFDQILQVVQVKRDHLTVNVGHQRVVANTNDFRRFGIVYRQGKIVPGQHIIQVFGGQRAQTDRGPGNLPDQLLADILLVCLTKWVYQNFQWRFGTKNREQLVKLHLSQFDHMG